MTMPAVTALRHTITKRCISTTGSCSRHFSLPLGTSSLTVVPRMPSPTGTCSIATISSRMWARRSIPSQGVASRMFLSTPPSPDETDFSKMRRFEDANPERIHGINVNPVGLGSTVLPGNLVYKHYKWTGNTRKVPLELVHGYFWMLKDMKNTGGKPILPNEALIPEDEAQMFPMLTGLQSLSKVTTDVPYYFLANKGTWIAFEIQRKPST